MNQDDGTSYCSYPVVMDYGCPNRSAMRPMNRVHASLFFGALLRVVYNLR